MLKAHEPDKSSPHLSTVLLSILVSYFTSHPPLRLANSYFAIFSSCHVWSECTVLRTDHEVPLSELMAGSVVDLLLPIQFSHSRNSCSFVTSPIHDGLSPDPRPTTARNQKPVIRFLSSPYAILTHTYGVHFDISLTSVPSLATLHSFHIFRLKSCILKFRTQTFATHATCPALYHLSWFDYPKTV